MAKETITAHQMRVNREANQRLADGRLHKPVVESLAVLWKQYGQDAKNPHWIAAHTTTTALWRKEGENGGKTKL